MKNVGDRDASIGRSAPRARKVWNEPRLVEYKVDEVTEVTVPAPMFDGNFALS